MLTKNEPPIFKLAFFPNTIPAGFIKNKLALPDVLIKPSISEIFPPVTRLIILTTLVELLKLAEPPVGIENSLKL